MNTGINTGMQVIVNTHVPAAKLSRQTFSVSK